MATSDDKQKSGANDELQPDKLAEIATEKAEQQIAFVKRDIEKLKQLVTRAQKLYKKAEEAVEKVKKLTGMEKGYAISRFHLTFIYFSYLNQYYFWITHCKGNSSEIHAKRSKYSSNCYMESRHANKERRYLIEEELKKILHRYDKAIKDFEKVKENFFKLEVPKDDVRTEEMISEYRERIKKIPKEEQLVLLCMKEEVIKGDIIEVDLFLEEPPKTAIGRFYLITLGRLQRWHSRFKKLRRKIVTYLVMCIEAMGGKIFWAGLLLGFLIGGILVGGIAAWVSPELREFITQNFLGILSVGVSIISIAISLLRPSSKK